MLTGVQLLFGFLLTLAVSDEEVVRVSNRGRCAGPLWRRENGVAFVRDADVSVMPVSSWSQYGAWGHRQELSIVAVSTRTRLFGPVVPPDGV